MRNLIIIFGDQLDHESAAFDDFDPNQDVFWMAEVEDEATHVWCHKLRLAFFFSVMRHFKMELEEKGYSVHYHALQTDRSQDKGATFEAVLNQDVKKLKPKKLVSVRPGDYRVNQQLQEAAKKLEIEIEFRPDRHFYCSLEEFQDYAANRNSLLLEYFYRELRKRHKILMADDKNPVGEQWNFDKENRESFGKNGPGKIPSPKRFAPDAITQEVIDMVQVRYPNHPGNLDHFTLPVTRKQARSYLKHFIQHRLPNFGKWEDAMWSNEPFLYHSRLSALLNVKLLNPRECVTSAVDAYQTQRAPLNSVEGFIRQILGWREFIRGVYWLNMPQYAGLNFLNHQADLPQFFWDGNTDMECIRQSIGHVLNHGYAHHIHRLMVLGNFAQLYGVHPMRFHEWHMAMYLDAIDWVSLPNTLGMSQFGDGGIVGTKPYCSTGNYINKMSDFCNNCVYNHKLRVGDKACPFTTLYWDFLARHYEKLKDNPRMTFAIKNVEKIKADRKEMEAIQSRASELGQRWK